MVTKRKAWGTIAKNVSSCKKCRDLHNELMTTDFHVENQERDTKIDSKAISHVQSDHKKEKDVKNAKPKG